MGGEPEGGARTPAPRTRASAPGASRATRGSRDSTGDPTRGGRRGPRRSGRCPVGGCRRRGWLFRPCRAPRCCARSSRSSAPRERAGRPRSGSSDEGGRAPIMPRGRAGLSQRRNERAHAGLMCGAPGSVDRDERDLSPKCYDLQSPDSPKDTLL